MTVPSSTAKSGPYLCNGVTDVFNYGFRIVDKSHLNVILADADGVETSLVLTTHYTVSDVGADTGSINLTSAGLALAVSGTKLTVLRNPPFTQETDLQNQGAYLAETVEDRFDLLTMQIQTVKERSDRSIAVPSSDEDTTLDDLTVDLITVAGIADDVSTVAARDADIGTVADRDADIGTVAARDADIGTVAARDADIGTVAGISGDVSTVAGISDDVTTVAGMVDIIPDLAGVVLESDTSTADMDFVGTGSDLSTDPDKLAKRGDVLSRVRIADVASAEALTLDSDLAFIETAGYAAAGDGGDALYTKVATEPTHDGWLQSADGSIFAITKRTIRASQFNAFPSDTVSQHQQFNAALAYLEDVGGGCLEIDKDEPYLIGGTVGFASGSPFSSHIRIENKAGGILKASSDLADPVMRFYSGTTEPGTGRLTAYGLRVDNSDGIYVAGDASCTGFSANYLDAVYMHDYQCIGGFDALVGTTDSGGDSGFGSVGCRYVLLDNPDIRKQSDTAIYPSWDNSGTIDGYFEVRGGYFYRNMLVLTAKRNLKEVVWRGGLLLENSGGITTHWVNNSGWVDPARSIFIEGVKIKKTLANAIQLKGNCRAHIVGNVIEDVGYDYDGTGNVGANAIAVRLQGVSGASVKNNRFEMAEWTPVSESAFSFSNDTTDGTKTGGNHDIGGTTLKNWSRYAVGGDDGDPSIHVDETFIDCPASNRFGSGFHTASIVTYRNSDSVEKYSRINGREIAEGSVVASIANDSFYDFGDVSPVGFGKVEVFTVGASSVLVASTVRVRTSAGPHISALTGPTTGIDLAATGTPTGTTGLDGNVTLYAVEGHFYIENRSGATVVFRVAWTTSN